MAKIRYIVISLLLLLLRVEDSDHVLGLLHLVHLVKPMQFLLV